MTHARVTVIMPTLENRSEKLERATASVRAQTFSRWELFIIHNDGPRERWFQAATGGVVHIRLGQPHPTPGHWNRLLGGLLAATEFVAYLDDDNMWRPRHLEVLVRALDDHPECGFAYSKMQYMESDARSGQVLGDGMVDATGAVNHIDASMIVHRTELLRDVATWDPHSAPPDLRYALDGYVVQKWLDAGVNYAWVDETTVDYSGIGYSLDGGAALAAIQSAYDGHTAYSDEVKDQPTWVPASTVIDGREMPWREGDVAMLNPDRHDGAE